MQSELILSNTLAFFLLWLFVVAGIHKLRPANRTYFHEVLAGYGIRSFAALISVAGLLELALAIAVVVPASRSAAALGICLLLAAYLLLLVRQMVSGKNSRCGCSGPESDLKTGPALVMRNSILLLMAIVLSQLPAGPGLQSFAFSGLSLLAASVLVMVYLSTEQLIRNGQRLQQFKSTV